jgi:ribosomal protein S18 acetylase RimI-like enzyme
MEQVTLRTATLNDLDVLFSFEQNVISAERPFDETLRDGHINYYDIQHMITAPHIELMVAELDSEIVGSGYARIEDSKTYLKHKRHAYLGFMNVKPGYRGRGINQKIIEALKQWSIRQGITELRLEVYYDNLSAIRAYEKVGFKKHMIEMRLGLDND